MMQPAMESFHDASSNGSNSDENSVAQDPQTEVPEEESAAGDDDTRHSSSGNPDSVHSSADTVADAIARQDNKAACHLRVLVIALFVFMSVFVPIVIFLTASRNEEEGFQQEFDALATKVVDSFEFNVARKLGAIDSLDISVTSYASGTNSTFPFVTMPDFDLRAANTLALSDTFSVFLVPFVPASLRGQYEEYTVLNQGWIEEALSRETAFARARDLQEAQGIQSTIFKYDDAGNKEVTSGVGPFFPIWQNAPVKETFVNFDLASLESSEEGIDAMMASQEAVLGKVGKVSDWEQVFQEAFGDLVSSQGSTFAADQPTSSIFYPVFDKFGEGATFVALLSTVIFWHTFFEGILPSNAEGIICVVQNECGQSFTYEINGQDPTYLGEGDRHDSDFGKYARSYEIASIQQSDSFTFREASIPLNKNYCPYTLTVYPSETLEEQFVTFKPALYTFCVALAFILISAVAITYDCVVQRRLKAVLESALESRAIVSSLFPANVRDRLFEQDGQANPNEKGGAASSGGGANGGGDAMEKAPSSKDHMASHPAKMRLKSFLHDGPKGITSSASVMQSKPIADLFPHATVLFADIAGFTAWSSEREPAQVFMLLQTIFHFFDNIARKWGVFKVETIGDCYVAVTGLPDVQPDHAIRMTKFARECLRKVTDLTHKLESSLGPDTGDLSMRFGLHSGPVTAGVLRGEKSRFQLFGDTVNTASRMESTGKKENIQISQATADLLVEAGKECWIHPRDELVSIKGKGQIQTYWVNVKLRAIGGGSSTNGTDPESSDRSSNDEDPDAGEGGQLLISKPHRDHMILTHNRKLKRLVDWQTDILARLLKPLVAQRDRKSNSKYLNDPANALRKGDCVLDEVVETLVLPKFNPHAAKSQGQTGVTELSPAVMAQLRDFVETIASKYHNNPFHNFEHASHVTMSASKLLNRIVIPEDVNYQRKSAKAIASDLHDYTYGITSDPLTQFTVLFCALIHDAEHAGVSNMQLAIENPDMAVKYKNRSLAEQNSVDIAWETLMLPDYRNLQQCIFTNENELKRFRQLVVNSVMATDIFDKDSKALRNSRWDKAFHRDVQSIRVSEAETTNLKATIVIEHIIQAADVAHTMQHWHVYTKWNERLFQEMYSAYESGRSAKDPSEGWYNGELWFFDNYVIPLAKKLDECNVFGVSSDEGLNYALANRSEWAVKGKEMVDEMVQRVKKQTS